MGFFISHFIFKNRFKEINSTYAIIVGLVFYAALYLYFLFYNNDLLSFFNNILIYTIALDLLLTTFYTFKLTHHEIDESENTEDEEFIEEDLISEIIEVEPLPDLDTNLYDIIEETTTEMETTTEAEMEEPKIEKIFEDYENEKSKKEVEKKPKQKRRKKVTIIEEINNENNNELPNHTAMDTTILNESESVNELDI
jgi:Ca2+/Na+ antiporter